MQGRGAISDYSMISPRIVLSHDCPTSVLSWFVTNPCKDKPSRTNVILQQMLERHRPCFWIFGHHHQTNTFEIDGTTFYCLSELDYLTLEPEGICLSPAAMINSKI